MKTPSSKAAPRAKGLDAPTLWARLDPDGMGDRIEGFAAQLRAGVSVAERVVASLAPHRPRRVVLFGMGGSAIAGDMVRALVDREGASPFHVVRHYEPPAWITPEDFLIFSSYSGETEETLTAFRATRYLGARSVVLSTGGTLARLAGEDRIPTATLPAGHPPRAALGYSFSTLIQVASHMGLLLDGPARLEAAAKAVEGVISACRRTVIESRNPAKKLAIRLSGRTVVVIANERTLGPVAQRWKGQLNENSKHMAWASPLPEMNHNEVDGYVHPPAQVGRMAAALLRDPEDHPRVKARFQWLQSYLKRKRVRVETYEAKGADSMARLMKAAVMGDFVSYYLALANGTDPMALPGVTSLKKALQR
ncbi:MAG: bifunctional phosphoglucose/phosphomannose isomerase [Candidatus Eiseniibacteriota bacterium]